MELNIIDIKTDLARLRKQAVPQMRYLSKHFTKAEVLAVMGKLHGSENVDLFREWWGKWKDKDEPKAALEERRKLKAVYDSLYKLKAKELTGRENVEHRWDAQYNTLLKSDWEHYGSDEMENLMYLFFSDKVYEVASLRGTRKRPGTATTCFMG